MTRLLEQYSQMPIRNLPIADMIVHQLQWQNGGFAR